MSDEEVDLNAMIQNDRRRKFDERTKRRQQSRNQRRDYRESHRDNDRRDRSRDDRRDDRREERRDRGGRDNRKDRRRDNRRPQNELVIQSYAISATGFVSDVSLDDILKLAKGKKIINIKAFFERQDGKPLEAGKDNSMSVIINFVQKQDATEFIKEYSDKMLDGKNPLVFQFRRGIVSRRPKRSQKQESDNESDRKQGGAKSEQQQNDKDN